MGFLTSLISSLFTPSKLKDRGYIPECTKEEIKNCYNEYVKKYGKNCFYCFEPWTYILKKYIPGCGKNYKTFIQNHKNLSIDRLDNNKTYKIQDPVQIIEQKLEMVNNAENYMYESKRKHNKDLFVFFKNFNWKN